MATLEALAKTLLHHANEKGHETVGIIVRKKQKAVGISVVGVGGESDFLFFGRGSGRQPSESFGAPWKASSKERIELLITYQNPAKPAYAGEHRGAARALSRLLRDYLAVLA